MHGMNARICHTLALIGLFCLAGCFFTSETPLIAEDEAIQPFTAETAVTLWSQEPNDPAIWTRETNPDGTPTTVRWQLQDGDYLLTDGSGDAAGDRFVVRLMTLEEGGRTLIVQVGSPEEPGEYIYGLALIGEAGRLYFDLPSPDEMDAGLAERLECARTASQSCQLSSRDDLRLKMAALAEDVHYEGYMKFDLADGVTLPPEDAAERVSAEE
jgi:hypothetical protein